MYWKIADIFSCLVIKQNIFGSWKKTKVQKKWQQNAISVHTSTFSNDKYLTCGFLSKSLPSQKGETARRSSKIFHLLLRLPEHRCQVFLLTCTLARCSLLCSYGRTNGKYTGPPGGPARPNASSIAESNPSLVRPGFLALAVYVSSQ